MEHILSMEKVREHILSIGGREGGWEGGECV